MAFPLSEIVVVCCSLSEVLERVFVVERCEFVTLSLVKFILEFDPVQTECVEEALHHVHAHEHTKGEGDPHEVADPQTEECAHDTVHLESGHNSVFKEHSCQLTMCK